MHNKKLKELEKQQEDVQLQNQDLHEELLQEGEELQVDLQEEDPQQAEDARIFSSFFNLHLIRTVNSSVTLLMKS